MYLTPLRWWKLNASASYSLQTKPVETDTTQKILMKHQSIYKHIDALIRSTKFDLKFCSKYIDPKSGNGFKVIQNRLCPWL